VLDDELIELIDASTAAPAWPGTIADPEYVEARMVDDEAQPDSGEENTWLTRFVERLGASYDDLTALDREAGDGDFGQNMEAAFGDVVRPVRGTDADVLNFFAHRMLVRAGGTSGAVLGTFFRAMADVFESDGVDSREADGATFGGALAGGLRRGVDAITELGGAKEGDNTLIDALAPAAKAAEALGEHGTVDDVLAELFSAAVEGAKATRGMQAKKGRASYLGEGSKNVPDPGAIAVTWLFGEAGVSEF